VVVRNSRLNLGLCALVSLSLLALGCGKMMPHGGKKNRNTPGRIVLLHGDPMSLVTGTNLNSRSFLPETDLAKFDKIKLGNWISFRRETPADEVKEKTSLEEGQEAAKSPEENDQEDPDSLNREDLWSFEKEGEGSYRLTTDKKKIQLRFSKNQEGLLELIGIEDTPVKVIHYSINPQKTLLSFLMTLDYPPYGTMVTAISFFKPVERAFTLSETDKRFNYLLGEGVITKWNEDLSLSVCGKMDTSQELYLDGINRQWLKNGKVGQRKFTLSKTPNTTPFSDVNSHCILFAEGYEESLTSKSFTGGIALPILDSATQRILDTDIIIFLKPFNKHFSAEPIIRDQLIRSTILHEFGHWLGLDHEFDPEDKFQSIMSYEGVNEVKTHDLNAVEQLYGPYDKTVP
jgi:hypothetical protein